MPISSYPRSGHPIAPSLLEPFLRHKVPKAGVRFSELDATAWKQFDEATCKKLGGLLVGHLASRVDDIKSSIGSQRISPVHADLRLEELEIEVRTFNCLNSARINEVPGGITGLTIHEALGIRAFGIKSLVDLMTSVEAEVGNDPPETNVQKLNGWKGRSNFLPTGCCDVIRRSGFVPASFADRHVPAPPGGIKLEQMGLRNRTLNALIKAGFKRDPTKIGRLTLRQAIALPNFGAESLCDLIDAVERVEHRRYPLFSAIPCKRDECRILLELIRAKNSTAESVLTSTIPPLPPGTTIADLCLQRRTRNVLDRERITGISQLAVKTVGELIELRGFGEVCILDLLTNVCRLREAAGYLVHGGKSLVHDVNKAIDDICIVPGVLQVDQSDPRLGRLLRKIDASIPAIGDLRHGSERLAILGRREELEQLRVSVRRCAQQTVEMELTDLIVGKQAAARNKGLVAEYYGFHGKPLMTLQVMGDKYKLTRERIRQICAPSKIAKLPQPPFAPAIDSALSLIRDQIPASLSIVENLLVEQALIEKGTRLESLVRVGQFLRRDVAFEFVGTDETALVLPTAQVGYLKRIEHTARKLVSKFGAAVIEDVLERCEIALPKDKAKELVAAAVRSLDGFRWLDEVAGWFWFESGQYTGLRPRIRKVLSVCGQIDVGELRAAIRRDHRLLGRIPPKKILLELCRQMHEIEVDGQCVKAIMQDDPTTLLKGDEARVVGLLMKHGPICRREDLQKKATQAGIGIPSFWRCIQFCPTIFRYAPGVYGLTGAKATPALIESLTKKRSAQRVVQDHGWTDDGRIWIVYRVSSANVESGVMGIPSAKRDLIQGEFQLTSARDPTAGTLVVKESNAWGIGPYLRRSGTEANDYLLVIFDTSNHTATVSVGDAGLLEFQDVA